MILRSLVLAVLMLSVGLARVADAQDPVQPRPRTLPMPDRNHPGMPRPGDLDLRRRLLELDRLISVGSVGRAETVLKELSVHSQLERDLLPRRIKVARLRGDHATAARLIEEALVRNPRATGLWRDLMESRLALGEPDAARAAADSFLVHSPNRRSAAVVSVELFLGGGHPFIAAALVDSLRPVLGEPRLLARQRALALLALDRQEAAAAEVGAELMAFSYNYHLLRTALLEGPYRVGDHGVFKEEVERLARDPQAPPEVTLLAVDLALEENDDSHARDLAQNLMATAAGQRALLRGAAILGQELRLMDSADQRRATVAYLLQVLEGLVTGNTISASARRRAAELIPGVCSDALELRALGDDPRRAVARCDGMLVLVRTELRSSPRLHAARLQLALYQRDELGEAARAARQLEHMLLDLDLPTEGVALVRLTLGETYFADGDTARGRTVLTRLGRDTELRRAAGHAHFHLARLDLAGGHYATARDRFAACALDNPGASYANNALELGLLVAEELENPTGGPAVLDLYAPVVYYDLTRHPQRRRESLAVFVSTAAVMVDLRERQNLLERGRWELAELAAAAGDTARALDLFDTITHDHADGRYPAAALAATGRLHAASGRTDRARNALERLLAQYPDYLFADEIRDRLRSLL